MVKDKEKRRPKQVKMGGAAPAPKDHPSLTSLVSSIRASRISFLENYATDIAEALEARKFCQVMAEIGSVFENVTPPLLENDMLKNKLYELGRKIKMNAATLHMPTRDLAQSSAQKMGIGAKTSLDDVAGGMGQGSVTMLQGEVEEEDSGAEYESSEEETPQRVLPYIKIVLRKTKEVLLFEQRSCTVLKGTEEARLVEEDNKAYDYFTIGKGRIRRVNTSEAQTTDILYKSRDANTQSIDTNAVVSYVSNFEMFDTYKNLETTIQSVDVGDAQQMNITTYKVGGVDQYEIIRQTRNFKLALMVLLRILSGNIFEQEQRRFRNMILPDPYSPNVMFKYSLVELFRFSLQNVRKTRMAVVDMAFCPGNGDIIAVAYGMYSFALMRIPEHGTCCIWNIKNPINPERVFSYNLPVVSVQFSASMPQLLAIGLFDGTVEVHDISNFDDPPIAVTQRTENSTCDPITCIEWLTQNVSSANADAVEIDPLLALSQDGSVTKYRIINSPSLLAFTQMQLDRVEGSPEGLYIRRAWHRTLSNRSPQGIGMVLHPRQHDLYFLLTDEGCIHKCSTNYPHQHLEVLQVHNGAVSCMDFSPWSPKVFLTAGNDWYIRIWIEGIFEPLISLKNENTPVHTAAWSKTHSTIIISNTRKSISIWDIRRSVLKPVSVTKIDESLYTLFKFARCGRSLAIGNERGNVQIMALEEMPFPPHFQYDELELAIYKAIAVNPVLTNELKSIGFFGYPEHRRGRHRCN